MNRSISVFLALLAASGLVWAQSPSGDDDSDGADGRHNQRIERIHHEDRGSRIDELRSGGETRSIMVQPKSGAAYQVRPSRSESATRREGSEAGPGSSGPRTWKIIDF